MNISSGFVLLVPKQKSPRAKCRKPGFHTWGIQMKSKDGTSEWSWPTSHPFFLHVVDIALCMAPAICGDQSMLPPPPPPLSPSPPAVLHPAQFTLQTTPAPRRQLVVAPPDVQLFKQAWPVLCLGRTGEWSGLGSDEGAVVSENLTSLLHVVHGVAPFRC